MKNAKLVSVTFAATLFFTVGAIGQQETLLIDLRIEPVSADWQVSLYDAASANHFQRFATLYAEAPQPEYAELYRLWSWSMQDPIGAFYGAEEYERLAALYPRYRAYIDRHRIVDSNGNTFYPTAETRQFLLAEAIMGAVPVRREPMIRIAAATEAPVSTPAPERRENPAAPLASPAAVAASRPLATPLAAPLAAPRATTVATPTESPAAVAASHPAPAPLASPAPLVSNPPASSPLMSPAPVEPERVRGVVRRNEANRGALSRSILLMIAGLIGIGMITIMLHAPREEHDRNLTSQTP